MPHIHTASRQPARRRDAADDTIHWSQRGACRNEDPNLFHAGENNHPGIGVYNTALAICARCTVTTECLQWALNNQTLSIDPGVFGGTTPEDRAHIRQCNDPNCGRTEHPAQRQHNQKSGCPGSRHDTLWAYRDGCRCPETVNAWRTYRRATEAQWRAKNRHVTGVSRGPRPLTGYEQTNVDMACDGRKMVLSVAEMRAAVAHLLTAGLTGLQVAERLHVNSRTVDRYKAELRKRGWRP